MTSNSNVQQRTLAINSGRDAADCTANLITKLAERSNGKPIAWPQGIAKRALEECAYVGQRRVRADRLARINRRIRTDSWYPGMSTISFARTPDGKLHLVNGQHRTIFAANAPSPLQTKVEIIDARDMADVGRLYAMFDEPSSSRSNMEMLDGAQVAKALGLPRKLTSALYQAVVLLLNDMEPIGPADRTQEARDRDVRIQEMAEWGDVARVYADIIRLADSTTQRSLLTQGVMGSALFTLRHSPKLAREFWEGLCDNDGLRKTDPRARLLTDFRVRATNQGSIRQRVQRVAVAWNAFIEGRSLSLIKCHDGAPIVFKGTPKGKGAR